MSARPKKSGEAVGRITRANSQSEDAMRELLLPLKNLLKHVLAPIAEGEAELLRLLKNFEPLVRLIADSGKEAVGFFAGPPVELLRIINQAIDFVKTELGYLPQRSSTPLDKLLNDARNLPLGASRSDPARDAAERSLSIPLFGVG